MKASKPFLFTLIAAAVLSAVSCFDMYGSLLDNTSDAYRLSILEVSASTARILDIDADGNFSQIWSTTGTNMYKPVFADFNADGSLDILVFESSSNQPVIYYSDGSGGFMSGIYLTTAGTGCVDIGVADLDNNGYPDFIIGTGGGQQKRYYLNNYPSGFTGPTNYTYSTYTPGYGISPADFDNDGDTDIFIGSNGGAASQVWINNFNTGGTFTLKASEATSISSSGILDSAAGDLDDDGDIDIIEVGSSDPYLKVWINNGSAYFTAGWSYSEAFNCVVIADFNGDGALDAYVTASASVINYVLTNNGKGVFTPAFHAVAATTNSVAAGDIDMDGDIDLVMTDTSTIYIYENNGRAEFTLSKTYSSLGSSLITLGAIHN